MAIYLICFWALLGTALADGICPTPADILPCTCDVDGVSCNKAKTIDEIKEAFSAKFKYGAVRGVWIQGTPLTSLTSNIFGTVKSKQFNIEVNNITEVGLNIFNASNKYMNLLSLFGNQIKELQFDDISQYEVLTILNLGKNKIESIPEDAFQSKTLEEIVLAENKIKHIGAKAFANLPSLSKLYLTANQITALGPLALAMNYESSMLQIFLEGNGLSEIADNAFDGLSPQAITLESNKLTVLKKEPFKELVEQLAKKEGGINVADNPFSCKGCDYTWIVDSKDNLTEIISGFECIDGKSLEVLTAESIGCQ